MSNKKGFTLIEILVVMGIMGTLAWIGLANYGFLMQQGAANTAQNNLKAIYNAEKMYYLDSVTGGSYCVAPCNTLANINAKLNLNLNDTYFTYGCAADASGFACTAINIQNNSFTLKLVNKPIVLLGGVNCATTAGTACNPVCTNVANSSYCPND